MEAYKVLSTNMDVQDGIFEHGYFMNQRHAEDILKGYAQQMQGKDEVLDLDGKLTDYKDHTLKYGMSENKPAVYYLSHWGNYRMAMWIKKIWIQE
jgi:hypothetical protein